MSNPATITFFDKPIGHPVVIHACWEKNDPRPIWEPSTWDKLHDLYDYSTSKDPTIMDMNTTATANASSVRKSSRNSFSVPVESTHIPEKGRGLISTSKIQSGDLVWDASINTAIFNVKNDFHTFLSLLPYDLACDVLQWAYVIYGIEIGQEEDEAVMMVTLDLDEGSYMNHDLDQPTVQLCNETLESMNICEMGPFKLYATRDINPGEEITVDYYSFDENGELDWFHELADCAWYSDCRFNEFFQTPDTKKRTLLSLATL